MRKLIMKMSMSVDGFVGGPNGEKDWVFRSSDEASRDWSAAQVAEAGLIIMGRKSFETLSLYWPTAAGPFAGPMNDTPKAVFTQKGFKTSPSVVDSWTTARVFDGDMVAAVKKLKEEPGKPILAIGGAGFMRSLINTGLIDEYQMIIHPVMLGTGEPIFSDIAKPVDLKLVSVKEFSGGIVVHIYHPA
ncbi:dihydrofolate reductase family protein [Chitinophaga sp. Hz27]|uniref:dihydrofolate reductase family protein n=1 Tax=Chitinophaga sp. Hz27 TaxID=3347169 RepID=UPI0035DB9C6C